MDSLSSTAEIYPLENTMEVTVSQIFFQSSLVLNQPSLQNMTELDEISHVQSHFRPIFF